MPPLPHGRDPNRARTFALIRDTSHPSRACLHCGDELTERDAETMTLAPRCRDCARELGAGKMKTPAFRTGRLAERAVPGDMRRTSERT